MMFKIVLVVLQYITPLDMSTSLKFYMTTTLVGGKWTLNSRFSLTLANNFQQLSQLVW